MTVRELHCKMIMDGLNEGKLWIRSVTMLKGGTILRAILMDDHNDQIKYNRNVNNPKDPMNKEMDRCLIQHLKEFLK